MRTSGVRSRIPGATVMHGRSRGEGVRMAVVTISRENLGELEGGSKRKHTVYMLHFRFKLLRINKKRNKHIYTYTGW